MNRYKLTISYDGTHYSGWQVQSHFLSIQVFIQKALQTILNEKIDLTGAGRTDAGVHALGQTAHFSIVKELDLFRFHYSLNCLLPKDIRITKIEKVSLSFHARYSAIGKIYHYRIYCGAIHDPFSHHFVLHIPYPLDIEKMKLAASVLIGTHDFSSFAHQARYGSAAKNPIKTLKRIDIISDESHLRFELEADGFLYKMVRNIIGTLLEVGRGMLNAEDVLGILQAKDRKKAKMTAPPHGLFLIRVLY
jgi:tRNA pseudouridine38-40 synthase